MLLLKVAAFKRYESRILIKNPLAKNTDRERDPAHLREAETEHIASVEDARLR
jgi:hypothetical protein